LDGDRITGTITEIFERGIIGSKGTRFDMRPIYGETAGINYDKPYGGWGEVSTMKIEFI
jgi:hypothetical protein